MFHSPNILINITIMIDIENVNHIIIHVDWMIWGAPMTLETSYNYHKISWLIVQECIIHIIIILSIYIMRRSTILDLNIIWYKYLDEY
jgi:hypothetical protein